MPWGFAPGTRCASSEHGATVHTLDRLLADAAPALAERRRRVGMIRAFSGLAVDLGNSCSR